VEFRVPDHDPLGAALHDQGAGVGILLARLAVSQLIDPTQTAGAEAELLQAVDVLRYGAAAAAS
jgi:hypothetical protein